MQKKPHTICATPNPNCTNPSTAHLVPTLFDTFEKFDGGKWSVRPQTVSGTCIRLSEYVNKPLILQ